MDHAHGTHRVGGYQPPARLIRLHQRSATPVLLLGGTPRRRLSVASAFHRHTHFRNGLFISMDSRRHGGTLEQALQTSLSSGDPSLETGLFHVAARGTLFLDFLELLSMDAQRLLLEFVQRCTDPTRHDRWFGRIVAGGSLSLPRLVREGRFLAPLYDDLDKVRVKLAARRTTVRAGGHVHRFENR